MDISQALLCLISFSSPSASEPASLASCQAVEEAAGVQKKLDLDFHLRPVERDGSSIASIAGAVFMEDGN